MHLSMCNYIIQVSPPPPPSVQLGNTTTDTSRSDESLLGAACKESSKNPQQQQKWGHKINMHATRAHTHTQTSNAGLLTFNLIIQVGLLRFHVKREEARSWETIHSHLTRGLSARPPLGNLPAHSPGGARGQLRIRESCGSPWTIPPSSSTKPNWCRSVTNCCLSLRQGVVENNVRLELTHSFRHCNPLSHRSSADKRHGTDEEEKREICRENTPHTQLQPRDSVFQLSYTYKVTG